MDSCVEAPSGLLYRERLTAGWLWWLGVVAASFAMSLAVSPLGVWVAVVVFIVAAGGLGFALWSAALVIEVRGEGPGEQGDPGEPGPTWRVGRAAIATRHLGEITELDAAGYRAAIGPKADLRDFAVHRPWVKTAVRVAITDERDPTPAWLVGTRKPAQLAQALRPQNPPAGS